MAYTTIKVTKETRDALARVAKARRTSISSLVDELAEELDDELAIKASIDSYERFEREDPEGWAEYMGRSGKSSAQVAAEEFPEYQPGYVPDGEA